MLREGEREREAFVENVTGFWGYVLRGFFLNTSV